MTQTTDTSAMPAAQPTIADLEMTRVLGSIPENLEDTQGLMLASGFLLLVFAASFGFALWTTSYLWLRAIAQPVVEASRVLTIGLALPVLVAVIFAVLIAREMRRVRWLAYRARQLRG